MIVRNEAKIIRRCLDSVRPLLSHWCICDTGSTDDTEEILRQELFTLPGRLYNDPWVNFGHNRSLSMERARGTADYHLLLDADMVLHPHRELPDLTADQYLIRDRKSVV